MKGSTTQQTSFRFDVNVTVCEELDGSSKSNKKSGRKSKMKQLRSYVCILLPFFFFLSARERVRRSEKKDMTVTNLEERSEGRFGNEVDKKKRDRAGNSRRVRMSCTHNGDSRKKKEQCQQQPPQQDQQEEEPSLRIIDWTESDSAPHADSISFLYIFMAHARFFLHLFHRICIHLY